MNTFTGMCTRTNQQAVSFGIICDTPKSIVNGLEGVIEKIPNRRSIEERAQIVEECSRLGDWEADLILGKEHQGVGLTFT